MEGRGQMGRERDERRREWRRGDERCAVVYETQRTSSIHH